MFAVTLFSDLIWVMCCLIVTWNLQSYYIMGNFLNSDSKSASSFPSQQQLIPYFTSQ